MRSIFMPRTTPLSASALPACGDVPIKVSVRLKLKQPGTSPPNLRPLIERREFRTTQDSAQGVGELARSGGGDAVLVWQLRLRCFDLFAGGQCFACFASGGCRCARTSMGSVC